jgi:hypothetical protein
VENSVRRGWKRGYAEQRPGIVQGVLGRDSVIECLEPVGLVRFQAVAQHILVSNLDVPREIVPEADLDFYVQDALNEIEFLTGSVDTEYGALSAW